MAIAETAKGVDSMTGIQLEAYRPPIEDGRGIFPEDFVSKPRWDSTTR